MAIGTTSFSTTAEAIRCEFGSVFPDLSGAAVIPAHAANTAILFFGKAVILMLDHSPHHLPTAIQIEKKILPHLKHYHPLNTLLDHARCHKLLNIFGAPSR